jgi:hypothetical protein
MGMEEHSENGAAGAPAKEPLEHAESAESTELSPSIRGLLERFTQFQADAQLDRAALARRAPTASQLQHEPEPDAQ